MPAFSPEELARWSGGTWKPSLPGQIYSVFHDSRQCVPGGLYVALTGDRHDGHTFIAQAFSRGTGAAMVEESFAASHRGNEPLLVVPDTRQGLRRMAGGYRKSLSAHVIGVTGSVGKTTVKEMVADMLSRDGLTARNPGNWNNDIGLPLSVLGIEPDSRYAVIEVATNRPGEIAALSEELRPSWGVVTPVGTAHIESFSSIQDIAEEKAELPRALPDDGLAILDAGSPWFNLFAEAAGCRVVTVSLSGAADYAGRYVGPYELRVSEGDGQTYEYTLPLPGAYIALDALLAVAVAREMSILPSDVADALRGYQPLAMRWETRVERGVCFINDAYNANPMSMQAALETFEALAVEGSKWLVLGGMRELGITEKEEHFELGRRAATGPWAGILLLGDQAGFIAEGALEAGLEPDRVHVCGSHQAAVEVLQERVSRGDTVLLKASRGERLEEVLDHFRER